MLSITRPYRNAGFGLKIQSPQNLLVLSGARHSALLPVTPIEPWIVISSNSKTSDSHPDLPLRDNRRQQRALSDPNHWQWHDREGFRWLTCRLLHHWPHAFSSRHSYPHKPDCLAPTQLALSGDESDWATQVHGDRLIWSDRHSQQQEQADALATERRGGSVWIRTADCVPVLIAHRDRVAAIHAGWRGTAAGIVPKTVEEFGDRGTPASELSIAMGPAISGPVYQVSQEVADRVLATIPNYSHPDIPAVTYPDKQLGKVRLDLRAAIAYQLLAIGVDLQRISISPHCTWSSPDNFFSYRRIQNPPTPIQWSGIGLDPT